MYLMRYDAHGKQESRRIDLLRGSLLETILSYPIPFHHVLFLCALFVFFYDLLVCSVVTC